MGTLVYTRHAQASVRLLGEPLLAFLDIFVQEQRHIADHEGQHDLGEEL